MGQRVSVLLVSPGNLRWSVSTYRSNHDQVTVAQFYLSQNTGDSEVGDFKIMTIFGCWGQNVDVGDIFWMLANVKIQWALMTKMAKTVTNILKLSSTRFVANIRHRHRCNPKYLVNDDINSKVTLCLNDIRNKRTSFTSNNPSASSRISLVFFVIDSGTD